MISDKLRRNIGLLLFVIYIAMGISGCESYSMFDSPEYGKSIMLDDVDE